MIIVMSVLFMACGDPASYKMTKKEFTENYGKQIDELVKEQMRTSFKDALKGDKSKNEMKEEAEGNFSTKMKSLTGLTLEELQKVKTNWESLKADSREGYQDMTIKEILDYK